jgi:hypothetical protein
MEMSDMNAVVGLVFLTIGALLCFAGWPLYKLTVAISGFLAGGAIGTLIGNYLVSQSHTYSSDNQMMVIGLVALVTAIVGAWLAVALINVVAFFFGFVYFAAGTYLVLPLLGVRQSDSLGVVIVMGIVGGILAVVLLRLTVTLSTALNGAFLMTMGGQMYGFIPASDPALLVVLVLAALGIVVQYALWKPQQAPQMPASPATNMPLITPSATSRDQIVRQRRLDAIHRTGPSPPPSAGPAATMPSVTIGTRGERFCPQCGVQLSNTAVRFCNQCGSPLP